MRPGFIRVLMSCSKKKKQLSFFHLWPTCQYDDRCPHANFPNDPWQDRGAPRIVWHRRLWRRLQQVYYTYNISYTVSCTECRYTRRAGTHIPLPPRFARPRFLMYYRWLSADYAVPPSCCRHRRQNKKRSILIEIFINKESPSKINILGKIPFLLFTESSAISTFLGRDNPDYRRW